MNPEQEKIYAARYEWLRSAGWCPFAETDSCWLNPDEFDAEIDKQIMWAAEGYK